MPIKFPDHQEIPGRAPIVLLGANGSGKTRLGVALVNWNNYQRVSRIPAVKNINLYGLIDPITSAQAEHNVQSALHEMGQKHWAQSNELAAVFAKIVADDLTAAAEYRDAARDGRAPPRPPDTVKGRLLAFWNGTFPTRRLRIDSRALQAACHLASDEKSRYDPQQMSDGEKVALYFTARVLDAQPGIVVIDEPEIHLHALLARRLWNALEDERPDLRFVYLTHDIPFALSRREARFGIVRRQDVVEFLPPEKGIPDDLLGNVLGAATFTIAAGRIVFCEGSVGSLDERLYSAWLGDSGTAVVPVGGWDAVVRCVTSFGNDALVRGAHVLGIVDGDAPDRGELPAGVTRLGVREVEGLLCLESVFRALAHCTLPGSVSADIDRRWSELVGQVRNDAAVALPRVALDRARRSLRTMVQQNLANVHAADNDVETAQRLAESCDSTRWSASPAAILKRETERLSKALTGQWEDVLRCFPCKAIFAKAANALGMKPELYSQHVCHALVAPQEEPRFAELRRALEGAFGRHLPPREDVTVE